MNKALKFILVNNIFSKAKVNYKMQINMEFPVKKKSLMGEWILNSYSPTLLALASVRVVIHNPDILSILYLTT
jgi:hypothetical protein